MERPKIIAIDGPAGSGKSSISGMVAGTLGWTYVNTGALYRAIGLLAVEADIDPADEEAVAARVPGWVQDLHWDGSAGVLRYKDRDLSVDLGGEIAGLGASKVAKLPKVREGVLEVQRQWALHSRGGAILDGRDIGTVVFPDADLKIFLTASLEERARRRMAQNSGTVAPEDEARILQGIQDDIAGRDKRDAGRATAPLLKADDAIEIDTSDMTIDQVTAEILRLIRERGLGG